MNIAAIIISLVSFLVSLAGLVLSTIHDKRQDTIEAFSRLQEEALDKLYFYSKSKIEVISQDNKSEEYKLITLYLSRLEHFSVGVNTHLYNKKIAYRLAGEMFPYIYDKLQPMIIVKRRIHGAENVYDEFEQFVTAINNIRGKR